MAEQLKTFYTEKVVPKLMEQFGYTNIHQVPKVVKVTVNRGLRGSVSKCEGTGVFPERASA
jgi:ribosomal protein L5